MIIFDNNNQIYLFLFLALNDYFVLIKKSDQNCN